MEVQEQKKVKGNALYKLLATVKIAYRQTKSDLKYIKNTSNFWKGKTYVWGRTHLSVACHNFYWHIIKNNKNK